MGKNFARVKDEEKCGKPELYRSRPYMLDLQEEIPHGRNGQVTLRQVSGIVIVCPNKETLARHLAEVLPQSLCGLLL